MNNYIFIKVVGRGSYGEVNLVKHKTDRKQYVIKKLNLKTSSKRERRSAEQEAQLLSQLRHPNIVTYRESWEGDDCQLYIAMGFCEGGDLYHRLKQQKGELLPERQVVEWFVQIAMALQYLHERNILHRDLKTQNIFLTKTNIIKVGDLGIARVLENQNDMASTLIGTPYYMSPELFSNKPYNHKSDVWALGCCVYEMSTLKHAFNAKDMNSLVYRIVEGKLPQMPSRYDPQLGDLIKSMLCKRPEDRPDVKQILRQPYIKRQISLFLEATKEKTAKSRKKAVGGGNCAANSATCVGSRPKHEKQPPSPQPDPPARSKQQEKSQQHKSRNGVIDAAPKRTTPSPNPSSSDSSKGHNETLATLSNINIDIPLQRDEDLQKRPQSVISQHQIATEPVTQSVHKDSKDRRKPDPSPLPSPQWPPLRSVSGFSSSQGEDENRAPSELLDAYPKATSNQGDTHSLLGEKQTPVSDEKDDTMELLRQAGIPIPNLEAEKKEFFSINVPEKRSMNKPFTENMTEDLGMNADSKNDTVTLLKGAATQTPEIQTNLESTEKLLELLPPIQVVVPRPLPPPPVDCISVYNKKKSKRTTESKKNNLIPAFSTVSECKDQATSRQPARPLSARERRRLRQSQEGISQSGINAVRRSSYEVTSTKADRYNTQVSRSVSMTESTNKQQEKSDEDEFSSSTSSTECSVGDCRERKVDSSDMQDLVQMMTQTLKMAGGDGACEVEFKLNRKYRDTLVLHGKAQQEAKDLSLSKISIESTSGPAKIRRAIEQLRTDVVKGLGVKLLDIALEIMEEEDDTKRELCLRDHMGDEKYQAYAVMVRQLKLLEDIAFKA